MYQAIIAPIVVRTHPNADKLLLGTVVGHQVVVGLETKTGDLGIFFPPDGQLSLEYCESNRLLKKDGGYFDENRRVRAQKFRGERSEGLWMPLGSLIYTGVDLDALSKGTLLTEANGRPVCNRYETQKTRSVGQSKSRTHQKQNQYFKKHYDTPQWRFFKDSIPDNAFISITEKLHGTSGRYGLVLCPTKPTLWQRLLGITPNPTYQYLLGTRNVVLDDTKRAAGTSYYGNEQFRLDTVAGIELYEGEILYYEIVGYCGFGKPIMAPQPVKDKELQKTYGPEMAYTYGNVDGLCSIYVYRITRTSPEGVVTELSWNQVKQRCNELGIKYVPELEQYWFSRSHELGSPEYSLEYLVNYHTDGPSTLDSNHIREGVVVRVESEHGTNWYKNKSFDFGVLEGYIKDDNNYVDVEEAS
jgi:hypothetical protein